MHPRKAIREAFRHRLATPVDGAFLTVAEDRIFKSRLAPIQDREDFPVIVVYAREEKVDAEKGYGSDGVDSFNERVLDLVASGLVRGGENVDDDLDDLAAEIEAALMDWEIPGFETARIRLIETDIDLVANGNKPIGEIGLTFRILYRAPWRVQKVAVEPPFPTSVATRPTVVFENDLDEDSWMSSPCP